MRIPRSAIALFCTALQVCFGTVYAWSFFQTILVRQIGWTHTETAWAFSIAIFTLGVSAAWAGTCCRRWDRANSPLSAASCSRAVTWSRAWHLR